jgi:hypothetical protein
MAPKHNIFALFGEHLGQCRTPTAGADDSNLSSHDELKLPHRYSIESACF